MTSVCGLLLWNFLFLVLALGVLWNEDWFQCRKWGSTDVSNVLAIGDNYETTVLFMVGGTSATWLEKPLWNVNTVSIVSNDRSSYFYLDRFSVHCHRHLPKLWIRLEREFFQELCVCGTRWSLYRYAFCRHHSSVRVFLYLASQL